MSKEQAKDKIIALLALANRPGTPAEGETALMMAQKLADKHGLKIVQRAHPTGTSWFNDFSRNVDRTQTERAAQEHAAQAKKARSEAKRRRTRIENCRAAGYDAYLLGISYRMCPFKAGMTFGVNQRGYWQDGWGDAKADHPNGFGSGSNA